MQEMDCAKETTQDEAIDQERQKWKDQGVRGAKDGSENTDEEVHGRIQNEWQGQHVECSPQESMGSETSMMRLRAVQRTADRKSATTAKARGEGDGWKWKELTMCD